MKEIDSNLDHNLGRPEPESLETRVKLSLDNPDAKLPARDLVQMATMPDLPGWTEERQSLEKDAAYILDRFQRHEYSFRDAHARICGMVAQARIKSAAALFREAVWRIAGKSPLGVALARLLLGAAGLSLRAEAERTGFSHQAIAKAEAKLRKNLHLPPI